MRKSLSFLPLLSLLGAVGVPAGGVPVSCTKPTAHPFEQYGSARRYRKGLKNRRKNPKGCHDFSGRAFNKAQ